MDHININQENKIDLMDYIKVIKKRKILILVFLLTGLIIAGGLTFLTSKIYKFETNLEIGTYIMKDRLYSVEEAFQVIKKIESGSYGNSLGVIIEYPAGTALVDMKIVSKDPEGAKETLENINRLILEEHNQRVEVIKGFLEDSIKGLRDRINFLLSRNKEVEMLEIEVLSLQREIDNIRHTKVLKEPVMVSKKKPSLIFNLIAGGFLGFFTGLFAALGKEWWKKNTIC